MIIHANHMVKYVSECVCILCCIEHLMTQNIKNRCTFKFKGESRLRVWQNKLESNTVIQCVDILL